MGIENTLFATCCNNLGLTYKKMQKRLAALTNSLKSMHPVSSGSIEKNYLKNSFTKQ